MCLVLNSLSVRSVPLLPVEPRLEQCIERDWMIQIVHWGDGLLWGCDWMLVIGWLWLRKPMSCNFFMARAHRQGQMPFEKLKWMQNLLTNNGAVCKQSLPSITSPHCIRPSASSTIWIIQSRSLCIVKSICIIVFHFNDWRCSSHKQHKYYRNRWKRAQWFQSWLYREQGNRSNAPRI